MSTTNKHELCNYAILRIMHYAAQKDKKGDGGSGYRPLLAVCRRWRLVLLEYLCSEYSISFSLPNRVIEGVYPLWSDTQIKHDPGSAGFGYISKVRIEINYNDIFNGTVVHSMLYNLNDAFYFPAAKTMSIFIEHTDSSSLEAKAGDYDNQARVLVRHVRRIAPAIRNMNIQYYVYNNIQDVETRESFARLLTGLFYNKESSCLEMQPNDFSGSAEPYIAHSLTDIVCTLNMTTFNYVISLIQSSAKTLKSLKVTNIGLSKNTFIQMFSSVYDRSLVTYPRLEKFWLGASFECDYTAGRPYLANHVPFPKLKRLQLEAAYPFSDDILFRQTERTLEYLSILPDIDTLEMLDRAGMFASNRFRKLKHICVLDNPRELGKSAQVDHIWAAAVSQFVYRASALSVRKISINNKYAGEKLVSALVNDGLRKACTNLKELHLPGSLLTLADIIALIVSVPSLCELHCMSAGIGKDYLGIPHSHLAEYMHKNYYPLSQSFKKWHICHDNTKPLVFDGQIESMIACSLLISVMCPRFTSVSVDSLDRKNSSIRDLTEINFQKSVLVSKFR